MKTEDPQKASVNSSKDNTAKPQTPIPPRDTAAGPELVDLSNFYNSALDDDIHHKPGNNLSALPKGIQTIGGIPFDIRGLTQLAGYRSEEITTLVYPARVDAITVNCSGVSLHFLHAAAWNIDDPQKPIGEYVVHYEDGQIERIPLVYKENVWDWWAKAGETDKKPAWQGENERTRSVNHTIRLFILSWPNPRPNLKIDSIDLVSNCLGPGPFVVAITVS